MNPAFPRVFPVRQKFPQSRPLDIPGTLRIEFEKIRTKIRPGSSVALAVGSRGITNIAQIIRSLVEILKSSGARPFIIPAMGSHGGATPQGQADILATYGITESTMGASIDERRRYPRRQSRQTTHRLPG
jgi:hypothetical protein